MPADARAGGRLAFIVSADICEGVFAPSLWAWVTEHFCLDGVVTFAPSAAPFPALDTNALILLVRKDKPRSTFTWARVEKPDAEALDSLLLGRSGAIPTEAISSCSREVAEGISTGLSRPPHQAGKNVVLLRDLASVMRGVATGSNDFFTMTAAQIRKRGLHASYFVRCIGRTRDCPADRVTLARLAELEQAGRPSWLLNLPDLPPTGFPAPVRRYLRSGQRQGLPDRALIKSRRRWYLTEQRRVPPLLFAYLGRRSSRFILNEAQVVPLTGFLCVYPRAGLDARALCAALNEPEVIEDLSRIGKSYGGGAIKVEPRSLERLHVPLAILEKHGLDHGKARSQLPLELVREFA